MLCNVSAIHGCTVAARDGSMGAVSDFLVDDASWAIRWLVVDTGHWLSGKKVLLPSSVFAPIHPDRHEFAVHLSRQQVKDSPDISTHQPVSRQMETSLFDYFGWRPYWNTAFAVGDYGYRGNAMAPVADVTFRTTEAEGTEEVDPHLRSIAAITGYHIHASDGPLGHVEDFLFDGSDWRIRFLVVDTKNWWPGKKVLIAPRLVRDVDWVDARINLAVDRGCVQGSPLYDPDKAVDQVFEDHFHQYYSDVATTLDPPRPVNSPRPDAAAR